jgi:DNA-directed RNA polymerase specialized sigma subunit
MAGIGANCTPLRTTFQRALWNAVRGQIGAFLNKTLIMVSRYAHQNGEHIEAAMEKLQSRYEQAG